MTSSLGPLCNAEFQTAVSQVCNLQTATASRAGENLHLPHSERRQIDNLRYSRLQTCATPNSPACYHCGQ